LAAEWADLDAQIEQRAGRSIAAIFATEGEGYFRRLESALLEEVCGSGRYQVVACGGGVVLNPQNIRRMKEAGRIICLTARPDVILARVKSDGQRPLLQVADPQARIRALLSERQPYYQQADATVDTSDITPSAAAAEVLRLVRSTV
jgi:shikimate kinase